MQTAGYLQQENTCSELGSLAGATAVTSLIEHPCVSFAQIIRIVTLDSGRNCLNFSESPVGSEYRCRWNDGVILRLIDVRADQW